MAKFNFKKEYDKLPKCPICGYYLCNGINSHKKDNIIEGIKAEE